jgi:hypothetical protein
MSRKKISQAREAERQKQWDKMPEDVKKRRREFEEKMKAENLERFERSIQRERDQHPANEFVVIQMNRPLPFFRKFNWEDRLEKSLMCDDVTGHEVSDKKNAAAITLAYDGTIDDVASAIWFGKVISRDAAERTIEVQINEDIED